MNPLASISKNLREIEKSWGQIKTPETRGKAQRSIMEACNKYGVCLAGMVVETDLKTGGKAVSVAVQASVPIEAVLTRETGKSDCGAVSVAIPGDGVAWVVENPATVDYKERAGLLPIVPEDPAVVGDLEGSGTFYPETTSLPVELIGGWPERAEMEIMGLAPNRRHLTALLPDGRKVSVERTFGRLWKPGEKVNCRIVRAGGAPCYRLI